MQKPNTILCELCGYKNKNQAYTSNLLGLIGTAQEIEKLSPEGPDHPNLEYPWEFKGIVIAPVEHDFKELRLTNFKIQKMLKFIKCCFELIDRES